MHSIIIPVGDGDPKAALLDIDFAHVGPDDLNVLWTGRGPITGNVLSTVQALWKEGTLRGIVYLNELALSRIAGVGLRALASHDLTRLPERLR